MIKVERVKAAYGGSSTELIDLVEPFYERVKGKLIDKLTALSNTLGTEAEVFAQYLVQNNAQELKRFVTADPTGMKSILNDYALQQAYPNLFNPTLARLSSDQPNVTKNQLLSAFEWDAFRKSLDKGLWLANQLNIQACPYCNAQFTTYIDYKSRISHERITKARFDFDHFYPKSVFPFFALSFYNLIPSCTACNRGKSNSVFDPDYVYHPYHNDLDEKARFLAFNNSFKPVYRLDEQNDINIRFIPKAKAYKKFVDDHNEKYAIDGIYARHNGYVKDLLIRKTVYIALRVNDMANLEKVFNGNKALVLEYIVGTKTKREEILDRPLVKLHRDVAIREGLINT